MAHDRAFWGLGTNLLDVIPGRIIYLSIASPTRLRLKIRFCMQIYALFAMSSSENEVFNDNDSLSCHSEERYHLEVEEGDETERGAVATSNSVYNDDDEGLYADDPVADEEFTAVYEREIAKRKQDNRILPRRFQGILPIETL